MWLNIPLLILVFAAVVGISYWLVIRHPDEKAPATFDPAPGTKAPAAPEPVAAESAPRKAEVPAQARREPGGERQRGPHTPVTTGRR
jgi:zona occludens toxin (predicted ATPase)